jgi:hypothetical protein
VSASDSDAALVERLIVAVDFDSRDGAYDRERSALLARLAELRSAADMWCTTAIDNARQRDAVRAGK